MTNLGLIILFQVSMLLGSAKRLDYVDLQFCHIPAAALPQFAKVHTVLLGRCRGLSEAAALAGVRQR